jgi:hypothetical protein
MEPRDNFSFDPRLLDFSESDSLDASGANDIEQAITLLNQINQEVFSHFAAEKIEVEGANMFQLLVSVKEALAKLTNLEKEIKSYVVKELYKYPKNTCEAFGRRFSLVETGVVYDYSVDPQWREINEMKKKLEEKLRPTAPKKSTTSVRVDILKS